MADGEACQLAVVPSTQEEWALLGSCSKLMAKLHMLFPSPDAWRVFWRVPQQYGCADLQKITSLLESAHRTQGLEPAHHGVSVQSKRLRRLKQHPNDGKEREEDMNLQGDLGMQSWSSDSEESIEGTKGPSKRKKKKVVVEDVSSAE